MGGDRGWWGVGAGPIRRHLAQIGNVSGSEMGEGAALRWLAAHVRLFSRRLEELENEVREAKAMKAAEDDEGDEVHQDADQGDHVDEGDQGDQCDRVDEGDQGNEGRKATCYYFIGDERREGEEGDEGVDCDEGDASEDEGEGVLPHPEGDREDERVLPHPEGDHEGNAGQEDQGREGDEGDDCDEGEASEGEWEGVLPHPEGDHEDEDVLPHPERDRGGHAGHVGPEDHEGDHEVEGEAGDEGDECDEGDADEDEWEGVLPHPEVEHGDEGVLPLPESDHEGQAGHGGNEGEGADHEGHEGDHYRPDVSARGVGVVGVGLGGWEDSPPPPPNLMVGDIVFTKSARDSPGPFRVYRIGWGSYEHEVRIHCLDEDTSVFSCDHWKFKGCLLKLEILGKIWWCTGRAWQRPWRGDEKSLRELSVSSGGLMEMGMSSWRLAVTGPSFVHMAWSI